MHIIIRPTPRDLLLLRSSRTHSLHKSFSVRTYENGSKPQVSVLSTAVKRYETTARSTRFIPYESYSEVRATQYVIRICIFNVHKPFSSLPRVVDVVMVLKHYKHYNILRFIARRTGLHRNQNSSSTPTADRITSLRSISDKFPLSLDRRGPALSK